MTQNPLDPVSDSSSPRWTIGTLSRKARQAPLWVIPIILMFVFAGLNVASSERDQDILDIMLDRPKISTDDRFAVVYEVELPITVLSHTINLELANGSSTTIPADEVVERGEGTLACDRNTNPNCINQFGEIITFRVSAPEGQEPAGTEEKRGLLRGFIIEMPDGSLFVDNPANSTITHREEGILECNRALTPDCQDLAGEIVTFNFPYVLGHGLLTREDIRIQHEDGYQETVRPNRLREIETQACAEDETPLCINGEITLALARGNVIGTEVHRNDDEIRVRTVNEQTVNIPAERIIEREEGLVSCDREANPRCQDFEGVSVSRRGTITEGRLTLENNRALNIIPEGQTSAIEIRKTNIAVETRTPEDCRPDNVDVICNITVQEHDDIVAGSILEDTSESLTIQTVAPVFLDIPADSREIRRSPMTCALNNLRGCNEAIWLTLFVTFVAYGIALAVGLVVGLMRVSSNPILYHIATLYVELVRGLPLLVILLFFAFVVGPTIRDTDEILGIPIGKITQPPYNFVNRVEVAVLGEESFLSEAVLGLAIGYAAFLAEVFRAGIESIGRGQMEAARSLGMSYPQAMRKVVLPQAIRVVLPPLGNDFIAMLKDSALISVLALPDLLQSGRLYIARTFQPIPVYIMVALLYIALTLCLSMIVRFFEKRFRLP